MKYISIDLETTGLDPDNCDIIEVGAVIDDLAHSTLTVEQLPYYHTYIMPKGGKRGFFRGQPEALAMHAEKFARIAARDNDYCYIPLDMLAASFNNWLETYIPARQPRIVAGKNYATFDMRFLERVPRWSELIRLGGRVIDPGMLWWWPDTDEKLPNTDECLRRAGRTDLLDKSKHCALTDARAVVSLVRAGRHNLLKPNGVYE